MTFWTVLCLNRLVIQLVFWHISLNSASRQHHEVWASQFPFHNMLQILFLLVSLAFTVTPTGLWHKLTRHPHLDCHRPQPSMMGARTKPNAAFRFNVQKWPMLEYSDAFLAPHLETKPDSCLVERKSAADASMSSTDSRKKGSHGGWCS